MWWWLRLMLLWWLWLMLLWWWLRLLWWLMLWWWWWLMLLWWLWQVLLWALWMRSVGEEEKLVKELQGSVQVDFDPAGRFLDGFSVVVWSPAFDKGQAEDALAAEVVDADSGG